MQVAQSASERCAMLRVYAAVDDSCWKVDGAKPSWVPIREMAVRWIWCGGADPDGGEIALLAALCCQGDGVSNGQRRCEVVLDVRIVVCAVSPWCGFRAAGEKAVR